MKMEGGNPSVLSKFSSGKRNGSNTMHNFQSLFCAETGAGCGLVRLLAADGPEAFRHTSSCSRNLSGQGPSILLRKTVLGLSLLRSTAQTRTFENTLISAACKKTQGKLWKKERGPDGAGPLDRIMRCSKISAAFIAVFKNSAEQNGIFTICSLRILLRWENRIRQKDKVSAGKIRTRQ